MELIKTTRAVDCEKFTMRVRAASMVVAGENRNSTSLAEKAMAEQMFNNPGRPPESLAWMVAATEQVNALIDVDEFLTVSVDRVTDDVILAAVREVWPLVAGAAQ